MKRLLVFFVSSLLLLIFNLPSVYACSYGEIPPPTVDTMLQADVLVRGVVIENSGGSSIIEVERYLLGSGSRCILLSRQSPSFYVSAHVRGYDYGCGYAASEVASVGTSAYFSLGYWADGSYGISYLEQPSIFSIVDDADGQHVSYWEDVDGTPEVKRHISNIYAKLGASSRTQAVSRGKELNLFNYPYVERSSSEAGRDDRS